MRKEAEAFREMSRAEREQLLQEKRLLVDDVKAAEKNVKPAIEAVLEAKTMLGIELREESKRLEEEAKAKRAKEEEERMEIVRQIRALESVPVDRTVQFDPTSVSDSSRHVLEAMSMAELLERLEMVKQQAKELEDEKRKEIILSKQAREDDLISRVQTIHKVREIRKKDAREQRMRKLKKAEEEKELRLRLRNEAQLKLQEEIEMKRKARIEEDEMLRKEMEMIEIKKQFLAAGAAQMEEKKFRDLEAGAERKLRDRQARERLEHQAYLASMQEEEKNRKKVLKLREKTRKELVREYDERVREGVAAMVDALATTHAEKRRVVEQTRDFESTLKDKQVPKPLPPHAPPSPFRPPPLSSSRSLPSSPIVLLSPILVLSCHTHPHPLPALPSLPRALTLSADQHSQRPQPPQLAPQGLPRPLPLLCPGRLGREEHRSHRAGEELPRAAVPNGGGVSVVSELGLSPTSWQSDHHDAASDPTVPSSVLVPDAPSEFGQGPRWPLRQPVRPGPGIRSGLRLSLSEMNRFKSYQIEAPWLVQTGSKH
eukprot:767360-Hanusia_phi.AAC.2